MESQHLQRRSFELPAMWVSESLAPVAGLAHLRHHHERALLTAWRFLIQLEPPAEVRGILAEEFRFELLFRRCAELLIRSFVSHFARNHDRKVREAAHRSIRIVPAVGGD